MKKLEKKILKKVYSFETKDTLTNISLRLILMTGLTILVILFLTLTFEELNQQQTLDIFEIFYEDFIIFKENIFEVATTLFGELPIIEAFFSLAITVILFFLLIKFIYNFVKIKNKIYSIIKYYFMD